MERMPVAFVGHGSPMNAVENNIFTQGWKEMAEHIPCPKAILMISSHWVTTGLRVNEDAHPKLKFDVYGFPPMLYQTAYPAPGAPELAERVCQLLGKSVNIDNAQGFDHGAWAVLTKMYPEADIPVTQLSVDIQRRPQEIYEIGKLLRPLRDENVLIIGSGSVVHNIQMVDWDSATGYPWADAFDKSIREHIVHRDDARVVNYEAHGPEAQMAVLTIEHYLPLLYVLGASYKDDVVHVFNDARVFGSLSMTSYLWT